MPRLLELFKGTSSIGTAFEWIGWEVISVDLLAKFCPTHVADVATFDYKQYAPDYFDFVWGSPPCTEFSMAKTCGERDIETATKLVEKTLEIIRYFKCPWAFENPQSGLLKKQPCVQGIPLKDVSYCKYGMPYRKLTRIWTDLGDDWCPRPTCLVEKCSHKATHGLHPMNAQRGATRVKGERRVGDDCSLAQLYSMPPNLCDEIAAAADWKRYTLRKNVAKASQTISARYEEKEEN